MQRLFGDKSRAPVAAVDLPCPVGPLDHMEGDRAGLHRHAADPFAQDERTAWTGGTGVAGAASDPHPTLASSPANRQPPNTYILQRMFL